jgi:tetratricopeptide (TPR) repeat protein
MARLLHNIYEASRSQKHLDLAITAWRRAILSMPDDSTSRCPSLQKLGKLLYLRYASNGGIEDLQDAATVWRQALELIPESDEQEAVVFTNMGAVLRARFRRLGNMDDLEQAVMMNAHAIGLTPDGHPDKSMRLNNLGIALLERFQRLGGMDDLEQALVMNTRAVDLTPDEHPDKPGRLSNLGNALQERFQRLGDMDDLEQALVMNTRAVDLTPDGHLDKPIRLNNLGGVLHERFRRLGGMNDLNQAVVMHTRAVDLTPDGHPNKPARLNNLSNVLQERFQRLGSMDDLEAAVVMITRAIDLTPDGHSSKPMYLNNLGIALRERFERLGGMDDLEQAVVTLTCAVDLTPNGHSQRTGFLINLASIIYARYQSPYKQPADLSRAITASTEAATENSGNPSRRLKAAAFTTDLLLHDPTSGSSNALMQAHQRVVNLIPQVVWLGHKIQKWYEEITDLGTLVNRAAAVAIAAGEYSRAVEWLESGRTIIWSQLLHLRTPLDELRERDGNLAFKLEQVSYALEHASTSSYKVANFIEVSTSSLLDNNSKHPEMSLAQEARSHHGLAIEYDRLIKQIRSLDGFENFLCPKPFSDLVPASASGPVVIINVDKSRCDALILLPPGEIIHVPLPQFSYHRATGMFRQLTQVLGQQHLLSRLSENTMEDLDRGMLRPKSTRKPHEVLLKILADLWTLVVKPIVDTGMTTATVSISSNLLILWLFCLRSRI